MFQDRKEAGRLLAKELARYKGSKNAIVLAIPRGGVEVGFEIAKELQLPLDIVMSKKIPMPGNPELAIGAVSLDNSISLDTPLINQYNISEEYVNKEIDRISKDIEKRYKALSSRPFPDLERKVVILTDDGIAMGHTMYAAIRFIKRKRPAELIVAVPVVPVNVPLPIQEKADKYITLSREESFMAVGQFYRNFPQVEDEDVKRMLKEAEKWQR